jgi:hypothetical protein
MTDGPWCDRMERDEWYQTLDPGIRFAVRVLHAAGFQTCQSCAGSGPFSELSHKKDGDRHGYLEPTIEMIASSGDDALGFGALAALRLHELPVSEIRRTWNIHNGLPYESLWSIVFSKSMEDRADDKPSFVHGYQARGS